MTSTTVMLDSLANSSLPRYFAGIVISLSLTFIILLIILIIRGKKAIWDLS